MGLFRFVHAADLHLDTPFEGLAEIAPAWAERLRDASLQAFDALVDLCLERDAAFLLLAGDVYDGAERGIRAQLRLEAGVRRLSEAGVATLIVHGNHDPVGEGGFSAIESWPPGVTVFGSEAVTTVPIERDGETLAVVHGLSYARADTEENLSLRYRRSEGQGLQIGLLHCNVGSDADHAPYAPCSLEDLTRAGMDYWALGHVHRHHVLRSRAPWIVYPGNLQGRSPKPSERGAKGAVVVEVADGAVANVTHAALDVVRFVEVGLEVPFDADLAALRGALRDAAATRLAAEGRELVVTARLHGRTLLHPLLERDSTRRELLAGLRDESPAGLLWRSLEIETRRPLDRERVRGRGDFAADLLEEVDALLEAPGGLEALREPLQAVLARHGLPWPTVPDAEWLQRAEAIALDALEASES